MQETVITVSKSIKGFRTGSEHGSFKGWLLQTTKWRIADQFRKRSKDLRPREHCMAVSLDSPEPQTNTLERIPDPGGSDIEASWDEEWARHQLQVALRRVKSQVRARPFRIFQLLVEKQLSPDEVAKLLGVSRTLVYVTKHRLSKLFRNELRKIDREDR